MYCLEHEREECERCKCAEKRPGPYYEGGMWVWLYVCVRESEQGDVKGVHAAAAERGGEYVACFVEELHAVPRADGCGKGDKQVFEYEGDSHLREHINTANIGRGEGVRREGR